MKRTKPVHDIQSYQRHTAVSHFRSCNTCPRLFIDREEFVTKALEVLAQHAPRYQTRQEVDLVHEWVVYLH